MKKFEKSAKLDNVCYDVRGPVVEEADRMIESGIDILKLNIGNPAPFGFSAPEEIILDMMHNLRDCQIQKGFSLPEKRLCSTAS